MQQPFLHENSKLNSRIQPRKCEYELSFSQNALPAHNSRAVWASSTMVDCTSIHQSNNNKLVKLILMQWNSFSDADNNNKSNFSLQRVLSTSEWYFGVYWNIFDSCGRERKRERERGGAAKVHSKLFTIGPIA